MKFASMRLPGKFEDAFLYMEKLITITENNSVCIYDMNRIVNKLQEDTNSIDAPNLLFSRNDLIEDHFRDRLNNSIDKENFLKDVEQINCESIEFGTNYTENVEWDLGIKDDIVLDINIYNRRLYISTHKGLYHIDIDWASEKPTPIGSPIKRIDTKCIHTTAKYGTVNASCGSEGLFSFIDDFELGSKTTRKEKHIEEYSIRSGWFNKFDVVNYQANTHPSFFNSLKLNRNEQNNLNKEKNYENESFIIVDIEKTTFNINEFIISKNLRNRINFDDIQFVYNSSKSLFITTYDGNIFILGLERNNSDFNLSYDYKYDGINNLVSSIHTLGINKAGIVIETDENILLFAHGKFIPIFNDEVISIRTFPNSKYYKNIISLTTSEEIRLISVLDESI
jgi:hypothetical protein